MRVAPRARRVLVALLPIVAIVALWLLFFWRILTPIAADRLTFQHGDFTLQFLAYRQMAYRQFADGRFPVIEECLYSGHPFQADPQSQVLYPPVLGAMLLGRALGWSEYPLRALEWEVMLHTLLAALAMYAFLRYAAFSPLARRATAGNAVAATIGACAFAFGGFMTGYAMLQTAILQAAAWLPLILLALSWLATARRWFPAAALTAVLVAVAFTAGHPQTLLFVAYAGAIAYAWWTALARRAGLRPGAGLRPAPTWGQALLRAAVAGALAIGLSAAQLIPTLSFMLASTRASLPFEQAGRGFAPQDIALLFLTGVSNAWQPLFVGIVALALAVVAVNAHRARRPDDAWLWVALAIGALILSFGANAIGFDLAYLLAPGYRQFQSQERHAVIVSLALSALAAYGAAALARPLRLRARHDLRRAGRSLMLWAGLAFAGLLAVLLAERALAPTTLVGVADRVALVAIGLAAAGALFAWRARLDRAPRWAWSCAVLGLLVLEVFSANRLTATQAPAEPFPALTLLAPIQAAQTRAPRLYNHFGLPLNGACVRGLAEVGGGSPIVLRDYKAYLDAAPEDVMVKQLNVRHAVTWRGAMETPEGVIIPWFLLARGPFEGQEASTYRLDWEPLDFTGAWLPRDVRLAPDAAFAREALRAEGYQPFDQAYILDRQPLPDLAGGGGPAVVEGRAPGYIKVAVNADAPGLLAVSEAYHWNWIALINGREVQPVLVNGALLGAPVPAGPSSVEFSYRPLDLYLGAVLSALTGVILVVGLIASARRRPS